MSNNLYRFFYLSILATVITVSACTAPLKTPSASDGSKWGGHWQLVELKHPDSTGANEGAYKSRIKLGKPDANQQMKLTGKTPSNSISGNFIVKGKKEVEVNDFGGTKMMEHTEEGKFIWRYFPQISYYKFETPNRLLLKTGGETPVSMVFDRLLD